VRAQAPKNVLVRGQAKGWRVHRLSGIRGAARGAEPDRVRPATFTPPVACSHGVGGPAPRPGFELPWRIGAAQRATGSGLWELLSEMLALDPDARPSRGRLRDLRLASLMPRPEHARDPWAAIEATPKDDVVTPETRPGGEGQPGGEARSLRGIGRAENPPGGAGPGPSCEPKAVGTPGPTRPEKHRYTTVGRGDRDGVGLIRLPSAWVGRPANPPTGRITRKPAVLPACVSVARRDDRVPDEVRPRRGRDRRRRQRSPETDQGTTRTPPGGGRSRPSPVPTNSRAGQALSRPSPLPTKARAGQAPCPAKAPCPTKARSEGPVPAVAKSVPAVAKYRLCRPSRSRPKGRCSANRRRSTNRPPSTVTTAVVTGDRRDDLATPVVAALAGSITDITDVVMTEVVFFSRLLPPPADPRRRPVRKIDHPAQLPAPAWPLFVLATLVVAARGARNPGSPKLAGNSRRHAA